VGPRTLDVLIALVCRSYEAISKKDLLAQVWPEAIVEEGSPRFHIANLRWATEKEGHDISRIGSMRLLLRGAGLTLAS
jgi:DNA-binding winged helix-turn-helix (wHTH) protein